MINRRQFCAALSLGAASVSAVARSSAMTRMVVKAFDTNDTPPVGWYHDAYAAGFRLAVLSTNVWGQDAPRPEIPGQLAMALGAGLKIAAYTRNPQWWRTGISACAPYVDRLQFFCLDIETNPGVPPTRAMVDGVRGMGVRPVIYSNWSEWPKVMGDDTSFADLPLWDAETHDAHWDPATYTPTLAVPAPVAYGGWNVPHNVRVGLQQTEDAYLGEVNINISSFAADFLVNK
ncbi:hypothetical protein A5641_08060 [Mycobacterium sp. 1554424.7]|nr:hypothetical protein A5641_08060 [Mycobacterium sp. 1554424.7]